MNNSVQNNSVNNNLFDPQTGFQFKNIGSNKAIGILLIVLMSIMGFPSAIAFLFLGNLLGLLLFAFFVCFTIFGIVCGVRLIKKDKAIDQRIAAAMHRYNRRELEWEIQNNLVCIYDNPHKLGRVYFTNRFIICTGQGVFPYDEIANIRASRSRQKYGPYLYYFSVTDKNGYEAEVCRKEGYREDPVTLYSDFIRLCTFKNSNIIVDAETF